MSEKTKQSNEPNNNVKPHDRFFKKSMSYPEIASEFFKSYLPKEILEIIDLSTLKQENSSALSNELGEGVSDILYSVKYGKETGYISLLLEHQSTSDRLITFRIKKYVRHEVVNKSCGTLKMPPSMLLDEPTILNKERMGECSEV